MKITFFSVKPYDKEFFANGNKSFGFELSFFETHLGPHIVRALEPSDAICVFVNDKVNAGDFAIADEFSKCSFNGSSGFFY